MKFIHLADIHLGAKPDSGKLLQKNRTKEIRESLESVIKVCREEQIDLLLIAGDLFHRQPLLRELKEVNAMFASAAGTEIVLTAGNHDYLKSDSYYYGFSWADNVHMILTEEVSYIELPELDVAVYGNSYHDREIREPLYDNCRAQHVRRYEFLLAHGGDEKHIPIRKENLAKLGFTYIAMGHIHKPGTVIPDLAYYAGALEPIDQNDTGKHGYIRGEVSDAGLRVTFVTAAKREYIHLEIGTDPKMTNYTLIEKIRREIKGHGSQNIYKLILTGRRDPDIEWDLEEASYSGNVVELIDRTEPDYDFDKLMRVNAGNLLGLYIRELKDAKPGSVEDLALYEGVQALLETRKRNDRNSW